ncbi:Rrf2 family transcriptional regulator [Salipiger sp. P9]|uniref:RrF2 family transcriptional regulator n=1 Tax=Salipiger pentaromativorans TaxID=2943193 RepID=UPI002158A0D1|nr:Rrf2 family transcriptional regulator [Salipiger pentaromativorans]MCR8549321.1 Rrf2 family transcriptional regulator [Salipiger pentaromativorans]
MHLSKFTDYALRVCLYLGAHQDRLVPISEIARAHRLSQSNLMKVVHQLVDGGFLKSTRGRSGGIALARPAAEIRVGEVTRYMEGDAQMVDCSTCILRGACGLVGGLKEAKDAFYQNLDRFSLADSVLAHPRTLNILQSAASDAAALSPGS